MTMQPLEPAEASALAAGALAEQAVGVLALEAVLEGILGVRLRAAWGFDCPGSRFPVLADAGIGHGVIPPAAWPYVTGTPDIQWSAEQIGLLERLGTRIYRINQGYESPSPFHGDEFDFESGAWDLAGLLNVIAERRKMEWSTRVYCTWNDYAAVKQAAAERGIGASLWFHIADWNLSQHLADLELHGDVYAGQWASPSTNPGTFIPGTRLTLAEAGADLSVLLLERTGWQG